MRSLLLAGLFVSSACAAAAQTRPTTTTPSPGSASVKTQLQSLHYSNVQDLRRGPDGQWTGRATQNGVEKQVTISPNGSVIAR